TTTDVNGNRTNVTIDKTGITTWGYNLGLTVKPSEKLTLGVNYRSKIQMDAKNGDADFQNVPEAGNLQGQFDQVTFNASLPLPAELTVGASYAINEKWLVAIDYNRVYWNAYENLNVTFSNGQSTMNTSNYKYTSTCRLGIQYKTKTRLVLCRGYYFDESLVQSAYNEPRAPRNESIHLQVQSSF